MRSTLENELMTHLRHLSVDIGPRPVGSAGNRAAAQYIEAIFRQVALDTRQQRFEWIDWRDEQTTLEIDGHKLRAAANAFSQPCDVTAPTIALYTIEALEQSDLQGKIAVLCGELTGSALTPKGLPLYTVERDEKIIALLEAKQPAALITVNLQPPGAERLIEDRQFLIPSATASAVGGLTLLKNIGKSAHLVIQTTSEPGLSANVVGRQSGSSSKRIVLCAHYDTKIDTPGAFDNASGTAALLALAGILSEKRLGVGLEFIAFSDEEYFASGDAAYLQHSGHQLDQILAVINLDGVGQYLGANTIAVMSNSEAFADRLIQIKANFPDVAWVEPWPQSNHSTFAWRGVPSIALTSYFAGVTRFDHQPQDTMEWISAAKLVEVVALVTDIIDGIAHESLEWARAPISEDTFA